jgi:hypothetical protein
LPSMVLGFSPPNRALSSLICHSFPLFSTLWEIYSVGQGLCQDKI